MTGDNRRRNIAEEVARADYDAAVCFTAEDAGAEFGAAASFRDEMLALLVREGWLQP